MEKFPSNEQHEDEYMEEQARRVLAGEMVWMEREDTALGCLIDFYYDKKWQGFIDQQYGYGSTCFYSNEEGLVSVYETPALEDAREYMERYVLLREVTDESNS